MIENCKIGDKVWYASVRIHPKTAKWEAIVKELLIFKTQNEYLGETGTWIAARQPHLSHGMMYRATRLFPTKKAAVAAARYTINSHIAELEELRRNLLKNV